MAEPTNGARAGQPGVVVCGDVTVGWNLAREPLVPDPPRSADGRICGQRGGAVLLADLVGAEADVVVLDDARAWVPGRAGSPVDADEGRPSVLFVLIRTV
jgi:hypothetical protein